jgi:MoaA/NifB/PqqE/SkfB family radical SAM enzyme
VHLGPRSALVLRRERAPHATVRAIALSERAADAEFAAGALRVRSWPARLDFALTERCNLRCTHCITYAPDRTRDGTARTLAPWLVDRLGEALAYARYFGFVHGGESLTAPIFFELLAQIARARAGAPYVVHLLTNGVRLTQSTTRRLIDAGVRSIAVSLDGARAETNDAVRVGGRFDAIVANVTAAASLRRAMRADVRLGLSLVVMRENVGELGAFVDLAASAGVDWIKLEELAAVTPASRRSLVALGDGRARDAVAAACARAESLGLVAVDHTSTPALWRCQLDPVAERFLIADEYANRSRIHPCRVPWEHACVEPNGDIKLGDFYGPTLGSLAADPFAAIWSGPRAQEIRERAPASRLCGKGPVVCVDQREPSRDRRI